MLTVRVYLNDAAGGSIRSDESRQRAEQSQHWSAHHPMVEGYVAEDALLVESQVSPLYIDNVDDYDAAERAFYLLNADDRPNGQSERSLSVGDVVQVEDRFYCVAAIGFDQIAKPNGVTV